MKFSICIPNYNYGRYIGATIASVLAQDAEVEVIVADNASTDDSVTVVESFADPRVTLIENRWNLGFAGNLDRSCTGASGERMILLSSDDLVNADALATYARLSAALGAEASVSVFGSAQHVIDADGAVTGHMGRDSRMWHGAIEDEALGATVGAPVYRMDAAALLRASLKDLRTPLAFATTCYPRGLYEAVGGYHGGYLINPDKAFLWKLLTRAKWAFFVDKPLFSYRVHSHNQLSLEQQSGALKHLVDQYRATFDTADETLSRAGLTRDDLAAAFIEHEIGLRNLKRLAEGQRRLARRALDFGKAAFPDLFARSPTVRAARTLLGLGPVGELAARRMLDRALKAYRGMER